VGRDDVVGTGTRYEVDRSGIEPQWGRDFSYSSIPDIGPTQTPVHRVSIGPTQTPVHRVSIGPTQTPREGVGRGGTESH
jgi:hypothetical protein